MKRIFKSGEKLQVAASYHPFLGNVLVALGYSDKVLLQETSLCIQHKKICESWRNSRLNLDRKWPQTVVLLNLDRKWPQIVVFRYSLASERNEELL